MVTKTEEELEYPFYIKAPAILIGIVVAVFILHILSSILIPLAFSLLIAILLNPLYVRLERIMPKVVAIMVAIILAILVIAGFFYFLSTQISGFIESLPLMKRKLELLLIEGQRWAKREFGINLREQVNTLNDTLSGGGDMITSTMGSVLNFLGSAILIPIYVFMFLFYKPLLLDFLYQLFSEKHSLRIAEILSQTKSAIQSFMQGLMLETLIVCVLNSAALLIIGVPSAIVIGVIGGILNLLPYIGGLIAISLPVLLVTISKSGFSDQLLVIGAYLIIQFIDNNILVPRIVSKKVQINALMSIIAVLLGGALWGVSGMFLAIPLIGVLKIVFDRVDELKPWGRLLGDEVPSEHIGLIWQKRWDRIFRKMEKKKEMEIAAAATEAAEETSTQGDGAT